MIMRTVATLDDDIVTGLMTGVGGFGVELPDAFLGVPIDRLRYADGEFVDAKAVTAFHIDPSGQRHIVPGAGRQSLVCGLSDELVFDGKWRLRTSSEAVAPLVKAECSRRIVAALSEPGQRNLTAYITDLVDQKASGLVLTAAQADDIIKARQARLWVADMQNACRALIANADAGYGANDKWPAAPAGIATFAARF